ncbi:N-acetylmuramoyl-L-alanine amidase [Sutcliffiella cohnii]
MKKIVIILCVVMLVNGCSNGAIRNVERDETISLVKKEDELTYKKPNTYPSESLYVTPYYLPNENSRRRTAEVTHVMIHYTSNAARNPENPYVLEDIYSLFEEYGVSAHYIIDREGDIFQLVDESRVAFHAGKGMDLNFLEYRNNMNDYSIGIELMAIGTKEEMNVNLQEGQYELISPSHIGYTDEQYHSLAKLLEDLYERYPKVLRNRENVVGHDEYAPVRKSDPGSLFDWGKIGF